MRVPLSLMIFTCAMVLFFRVFSAQTSNADPTLDRPEYGPVSDPTEVYADPLPQTQLDEAALDTQETEKLFPKEDDLRLIGRIARGVRKVALQKGGGRWWDCGEVYDDSEEAEASLKWAYRIVFLAWEYSDRGSDGGVQMNAWGIAGVAANESGFDTCALGPWPRKWGYEHKTLKKNRLSISHPFDEIKATMLHPKGVERWKTTGLDAAPLHQLWRCDDKGMCKPKWNRERLPAISLDEVFSLGKGFEYNVRKMKKDAIDFKTSRPWLYWPGYRAEWYDEKVVRWAKKMGATAEEI